MNVDQLRSFYEQESVRVAVRQFIRDVLDEEALKAVYRGDDVRGFKEANAIFTRMFSRLEELYGHRDKPLTDNQAR